MLDEYEQELVKEILSEVQKISLADCKGEEIFDRITELAMVLLGERKNNVQS